MNLKVMMPTAIIVDETVTKILAEGGEGLFCIKPKHVDYTSALLPGILIYCDETGREVFVATDEGVLVKCGDQVMISTHHAVIGDDLQQLRTLWTAHFEGLDDQARRGRSALARLEIGVVRKFMEFRESQ